MDVTVRHPLAERYMPRAAKYNDVANNRAAAEKRNRYPARGGIFVTPFPVEIFGRLGRDAERYLAILSQAAEVKDQMRATAPRQRTTRWVMQLSRVLFRAIARSILEAQGLYTTPTAAPHRSVAAEAGAPRATLRQGSEGGVAGT